MRHREIFPASSPLHGAGRGVSPRPAHDDLFRRHSGVEASETEESPAPGREGEAQGIGQSAYLERQDVQRHTSADSIRLRQSEECAYIPLSIGSLVHFN